MTSGPLTRADFDALWRDVTSEGYWRPFVESEDSSIEVIEQAMEQAERASIAVDRTTQSFYIFPWSGQTSDPAAGERNASVQLRINRTEQLHRFLVFEAGTTILHTTTDYGPTGAVIVRTGRKYILVERAAMLPGQTEVFVAATAYRPGTGYNQPLPGTIQEFAQRGVGLRNTGFPLGSATLFQVTTARYFMGS